MPDVDLKDNPTEIDEFIRAIVRRVHYTLGKKWKSLSGNDLFTALAYVVRERLIDRMFETDERYENKSVKRLYYLSMEFLIGRSLGNNLINLQIEDLCREALNDLGFDLEEVREGECDAALGNGGLGRLAACFLDSLATLNLPGYGYGINYEYGLFKQLIQNGYQKEKPDHWLAEGTPWQIDRSDQACFIPVYGRVEKGEGILPGDTSRWVDWNILIGSPSDMPIVGYGGRTVNSLRLYSARASEEFDIDIFNSGDYLKAVEQKVTSERISKVLYPSDSLREGKELRLIQEYFFVACAVHDIFRRFFQQSANLKELPSRVAIHLNDTHPALAVAELMRMLTDEHQMDWNDAWKITQATIAYTNHTLLPEALEKWSADLLNHVIPRHLRIIYRINDLFLARVEEIWPGDHERARRMSIVEEADAKQIRMANLAIIGSHSVNGVAELHSELIKTKLVPDFYEMWPEKFCNKTNGITQRRWLLKANPDLSRQITDVIGSDWITNLDRLRELVPYAGKSDFQERFLAIKLKNKEALARVVRDTTMINLDPNSLFDVQAKRIHLYKRQLLNVLHIIHQYMELKEDGVRPATPCSYIFAGKAAPGYWEAKQVIKLINSIGSVINRDPDSREWIKVAFIPDYRVSLAEIIIPAADLSEQISTAGMEASGTGNMKFALNGALTIGTLDGANIEIREEVGDENMYIFGLKAEEIEALGESTDYDPRKIYEGNRGIQRTIDTLNSNLFCPSEPGLFKWIYDRLLSTDDAYYHIADLESYLAAQKLAGEAFTDRSAWAKMAILNVARMGKFSSDRTIAEYARDIWDLKPV